MRNIEEKNLKMKKVAIITRTKNRPILLPRALESVHSQTFKDFIWIIVNDGGEREHVDGIARLAKKIGMEVKVIHNKTSKGMEAASNIGIKNSKSKYIIIHDDDDSWERNFLKETVHFLESKNGEKYGGVLTHTNKITEKIYSENHSYQILRKEPYNPWIKCVYLSDISKGNYFPPISFLYRREIYNKLKGYDESLPVLGDWDFNLKFLLLADIGVIKRPLANYHHRTKDNTQEGYNNTVVHDADTLHTEYDAILRNRYLRQDIIEKKFGLGFLSNTPPRHYNILENIKLAIFQYLKWR